MADERAAVLVRPTIVLNQDCRYERHVEKAAGAWVFHPLKLQALLSEPLTRPLGSMQAPRCFSGDEAVTLVQNKQLGRYAAPLPPRKDEPVQPRTAQASCYGGQSLDEASYHGLRRVREHAQPASLPTRDEHRPAQASFYGGQSLDEAVRRVREHAQPASLPTRDERVPAQASFYGGQSLDEAVRRAREHAQPASLPTRDERRPAQASFYGGQSQRGEAELDEDTHHGLRRVREHAPRVSLSTREDELFERRPAQASFYGGQSLDEATYHGLRRVREHAHARLDSIESAAASGRGSARTVFARRSDKHARHASARREGLTDARNALRRAYAESKVRVPSAPPRSSARDAGVVDGWERLPERKGTRRHQQPTRSRAAWWATGLASASMLLAYALTLSVVPPRELAPLPRAVELLTAPVTPAEGAPDLSSAPQSSASTAGPRPHKTIGPHRMSRPLTAREHTYGTPYQVIRSQINPRRP